MSSQQDGPRLCFGNCMKGMYSSISRDFGAPKIEVIDQYRDEGWFLALVEAAQHRSLVVEKVSIYLRFKTVSLVTRQSQHNTTHGLLLTNK
jgi:hypothetical protein